MRERSRGPIMAGLFLNASAFVLLNVYSVANTTGAPPVHALWYSLTMLLYIIGTSLIVEGFLHDNAD